MSKGTIAIIGGGIGGIAAGVALLQAGFTVRVFERAGQLREAGAGVILWPNATGILHELGVLAEAMRHGQCSTRFLVRSFSGDLLMDIDTATADMPTVGLHRADLLRALAGLLPAECVCLGHELRTIQFIGQQACLHFNNGESYVCDGIVGADGIHSRIRTELLGASRPAYRGYVIFRGLVDAPVALSLGHNGETWGLGRRFGVLAVGKNKVCWYATTNTSDPRRLLDARKQRLEQLFRDWHHPIPALIAAANEDEILLNNACDHGISRTWSDKPVTLLGDAAHALTPNLGRGACLALEDAFVLAKCLSAHSTIGDGFRRYERLRFPPVRSAVLRSRWLGHVGQWETRAAVALRDAVTQLLPARFFECHSTLEKRMAALIGANSQIAISS
jgi:2-polyprenyl-6-methoxyphenol hydroxylase-like FAD-dependent oxidoreductase